MNTASNLIQKGENIGGPGSFVNQLYSNNATEPIPGEWCTFLHYTDRSVGKVLSYDKSTNECLIERYNTVAGKDASKTGMGHQDWEHKPSGAKITLRYNPKYERWERKIINIVYCPKYRKAIQEKYGLESVSAALYKFEPEMHKAIYKDDVFPGLIPGITKEKVTWSKESIIFNVCDYHYDWSF